MNRKQRRADDKINRSNISTTQIGMQNLAQAIKILEDKIHNLQQEMKQQFNAMNADIGNAYDILEAFGHLRKLEQSSFEKFVESIKDKTFNEPKDYVDTYAQFVSNSFSTPDYILAQLVQKSFDKRNRLRSLLADESPAMGDIAFISWLLEKDGQIIYAQSGMSYYKLGTNYLLNDNELLSMKVSEEKQFDVSYPKDHPNPFLRGKDGVLKLRILQFKRTLESQVETKNLSTEDQKQVWKEKFQAETIE